MKQGTRVRSENTNRHEAKPWYSGQPGSVLNRIQVSKVPTQQTASASEEQELAWRA